MKKEFNIPTGAILTGGLIIGGFLIGRKLLQSIGVLKTAQEQKAAEDSTAATAGSETQIETIDKNPNPGYALNVRYWQTILKNAVQNKKIPNYNTLNAEQKKAFENKYFNPYGSSSNQNYTIVLTNLAKQIFDSKSLYNDNEDQLNGAFQAAKNQAQISLISGLFMNTFKRDMWSYITSFTNDEERAKIYNIIKGKPLI